MSLHDAARSGDLVEISRLVGGTGVDPNCRDRLSRTPLHLAAYEGRQHAVECLLAFGANPRLAAADQTTALHFAAQKGHLSVVKCLMKQGLKVDTPNRKGTTALHLASLHGHPTLVRWLLTKKANPMQLNAKSKTPKDLAASQQVKDEFQAFEDRRKEVSPCHPKKPKHPEDFLVTELTAADGTAAQSNVQGHKENDGGGHSEECEKCVEPHQV